jgi:hypothetical protein
MGELKLAEDLLRVTCPDMIPSSAIRAASKRQLHRRSTDACLLAVDRRVSVGLGLKHLATFNDGRRIEKSARPAARRTSRSDRSRSQEAHYMNGVAVPRDKQGEKSASIKMREQVRAARPEVGSVLPVIVADRVWKWRLLLERACFRARPTHSRSPGEVVHEAQID